MGCVARRLRKRGAIPLGCAVAALWASPAGAESSLRLFTSDAWELNGDLRLVAVDGERSWVDRGFGKLRSGSDGDLRVRPQLGNISLVWKPQLSWSLGAIVVGSLQGGQRTQAGLSQAYLTFKPMRSSRLAFSARAGLMWPPISLEHEGAEGLDHPIGDQQLDRRGGPPGRGGRRDRLQPRPPQASPDRRVDGRERYFRNLAYVPRLGAA